jgi:hypothetical protein
VIQGGVNVPKLDRGAFTRWLESQNVALTSGRAEYIFTRLDANLDSEIDVPEYVHQRLESSDELLCHTAADISVSAHAFPGCPCNPLASAALAKCPAGTNPVIFLCLPEQIGQGHVLWLT